MNVIYMHTHDLGRYIGTYGYTPRTPNLNRLAEGGVLFRNAFCVAPTCSPSRAALVTGKYPHEVGMHGLTNQGWALRDYGEHFAAHFSKHGMETVLTGIQHVTGTTPEELAKLPYDRIIDPLGEPGERMHDRTTEVAIDFLKENHDKPFFLNVGYVLTHHSNWDRAFVLSRDEMGPLDARYVRPLSHLPDEGTTRWEAAMQIRATEYLDARIGLFLDALEETGLAENTLMIFTSDHGPGLPGVKVNLNDRGLGVPLIMRGPGGFTGGKVVEGLASHMDLFPTICDLMDFETPEGLAGKSLTPMAEDSTTRVHDELFQEQGYHGRYVPLRSIRTERFRYVRRYGEERPALYFYADGGEAYNVLERDEFTPMMPQEQLFDLRHDPQELVNRIDDEAYAEVLKDLRSRLDQHLKDSNDPALTDEIPKPPSQPEWAKEGKDAKIERCEMWKSRRKEIQKQDAIEFPHLVVPGVGEYFQA